MTPAHRDPRRMRRGAYLLPSLFTTGNILLGFYAVVRATRGEFQTAALLIFFAGVLDGFDGKIARMTGTESEFGKEYDSLADVLTFGAAPALITFFWGLERLGRPGWLFPVLYLVCTATRLARFNVQTKSVDSRWFVGLPSPAAAGVVASVVLVAPDSSGHPWLPALVVAVLVTSGTLMLSTFRYLSIKRLDLRQRWSYRGVLPLAVILLILMYRPVYFFVVTASLYGVSGPFAWALGRLRRRDEPSLAPEESSV